MVAIKLYFGDEIRRLSIESSIQFADLQSRIKSTFAQLPASFTLKWKDEEGDLITVGSDIELAEALKSSNLVRFYVHSFEAPKSANRDLPHDPLAELFGGLDFMNALNIPSFESILQQAQADPQLNRFAQHLGVDPTKIFESFGKSSEKPKSGKEEIPVVENPLEKILKELKSNGCLNHPFARSIIQQGKSQPEIAQLSQMLGINLDEILGEQKESAKEDKPQAPKEEKQLHPHIICDGCQGSVVGTRYKCSMCNDYDLCETCQAKGGVHDPSHVFLSISKPLFGFRACPRFRMTQVPVQEQKVEKSVESEKVDPKASEELSNEEKQLLEMGFQDVERNRELLKRCDNDVTRVIYALTQ